MMCRAINWRTIGPVFFRERVEIDHAVVEALPEVSVRIQHVRHAAAHPRRKIPAGPAEDDDSPAGHVLAAVIADALDHGMRAAVSHREPLAGHAPQIGFAARGAVQRHVADDDVLFGHECRAR